MILHHHGNVGKLVGTHGKDANAYGNANLEYFMIRYCLEGPICIEERIIKMLLIPKLDARVWSGVFWLWIETRGGCCEHGN
jgi:hypothetical protein